MDTNKHELTSPYNILPNEIWLVIDSLTFGGIESHVKELAIGLKQHRQPVRVVILQRYHQPQLLPKKLAELTIPCSFLSDITTSSQSFIGLLSAVKKYRPQLLHSHGYKASIVTKLVKVCTRTPQVSTFHAGETPTGRVKIYDWIDRYSSYISTQCLCVSPIITKKIPSHSWIINNFIAQPSPIQHNGNRIAFIGRLSIEKAPDRFVQLAHHFPNEQFDVYGDGPMHSDLLHNAPDNLTFHGHVDNLQTAWPSIQLLIIPSRFEGLPMVSLEAMGRGIPVISTNVGAMKTLVEHNNNGWIVNNTNDLDKWLSYWLDLSTTHKNTVRENARKTILDSYTDKSVIPLIIEHYQEVLL